jgi:lysophospholipase L1-like esterase
MKRGVGAALLLCVLGGVAFAYAWSSGSPDDAKCGAPADLLTLSGRLPEVGARFKDGEPLAIVAIGSSSTQGAGASSPARAYPAQLERELRRRHPGLAIAVANRGIGGEVAADTLERFDADALAGQPDLVIWQLGGNDAIRAVEPAAFAAVVDKGVQRMRAAGVDVVLVSPQYTPRVIDTPHVADYLATLDKVAARYGAAVFRRFEIGKDGVASGRVGAEEMMFRDRLHPNDLGYRCLALQLAAAIDDAAR